MKSLVLVEKDAVWFNPDGKEVSDEAWNSEWSRAILLLLNGFARYRCRMKTGTP